MLEGGGRLNWRWVDWKETYVVRRKEVAEWRMLVVFGVDISTSHGHIHFTSSTSTHRHYLPTMDGSSWQNQFTRTIRITFHCRASLLHARLFQFQGENKADGELQHDHVFTRVRAMTCSTK